MRLDEAGVERSLPQERIVRLVAVDVADDKRAEHAVNALLPTDLPRRAIRAGLVGFPIFIHRVDQLAFEVEQVRTGELVEADIPLLLAETAPVAGEMVEMVVVSPERIGGVAVHVVPLLQLRQLRHNGHHRRAVRVRLHCLNNTQGR